MTKQLEAKFYAAGVIETGGVCERAREDEAQFWTVYERKDNGTSQAICDCDSRQGADAAAAKLNALIAALEQAQLYAKQRDAENQDLMLTIGRLRVEREQLEAKK